MSKLDEALYKIARIRDDGGSYVENSLTKDVADQLPGLYKNAECVDIGGESFVFKADSPKHRTKVAVKVMLPVQPEPKRSWWKKPDNERLRKVERVTEQGRRFSRAILNHTMIYQIMEREQVMSYAYTPRVFEELYQKDPKGAQLPLFAYVMEFVEGVPLLDWCSGSCSDVEKLEMFKKLLLCMMHCFHSYAFIHTDLKAANIIVNSDRVVILDYGLSKNLNDKCPLTTQKTVALNSGSYSTERQRAFPRLRGYYEDIYSLGILMHNMITGAVPSGVVDLPPLVEFPPSALPFEFQQFFRKCIDERGDRFDNIVDMANQFTRILNDFRSVVIKNEQVSSWNIDLGVLDYVSEGNKSPISNLLKGFYYMNGGE